MKRLCVAAPLLLALGVASGAQTGTPGAPAVRAGVDQQADEAPAGARRALGQPGAHADDQDRSEEWRDHRGRGPEADRVRHGLLIYNCRRRFYLRE